MWFITKLVSLALIIVTAYLLAVFFAPWFADEIANTIWTPTLNQKIRWFKSWADGVWNDMLQIKSAQEQISWARDTVNKINEWIDKTKKAVDEKIDQTNRVIDQTNKTIESVQKVWDNVSELKKNIWDATSIPK